MSKRKYTHIQELEDEIIALREAGKTYREIAEKYNLEKEQIKELLKRWCRRQARIEAGIQPLAKVHPRKDGQSPHQNEKTELEQLRMENKLLRDFLQFTGRK